jgi:haloacetate dehalogenase
MSDSQHIDRRTLLRQATSVIAGAAAVGLAREAQAQNQPGGPNRPDGPAYLFPGFKASMVQTPEAMINVVSGGQGPPLLLLHGAPLSHVSWRLVAPKLAEHYTVIATDLRGYGDSSKPPDGESHSNYSKRAMALDQVEVMKHFGFDRFAVVGHDRGGRVAHRMALDHPAKVTKAAVIDIVPTHYLYTHVTIEFVQSYFHWFNYLRPAPAPENELNAQYASQTARSEAQAEYLRTFKNPATVHAMCEDYRAGASIDLKHDEADLNKKIACPLLVLWAQNAPMGRIYDVLSIWKQRGTKVSGKVVPGGHNLQEDSPDLVLAELQAFLRA